MQTQRGDAEGKRRLIARLAAAIAAVLALVAIAGCGGGSDDATTGGESGGSATTAEAGGALEAEGEEIADPQLWKEAQEQGSVTLYGAISGEREEAIDEAFTELTGIDVNLIQGTGSETYQKVTNLQAAGKLDADIVRQTDGTLAESEAAKGVFAKYCSPFEKGLPKEAIGKPCYFVAPIIDVYAFAYNSALVKEDEAPKSWQDLLDPKWKGKIGVPYIGAGGSTWARDLFLRKEFGKEYWEKLAAQDPVLSDQVSTTTDQLVQGEVEVATDVPPTVAAAIKEGAPVAISMPTDGVPAYGAFTGVAADARHEAAAKVFLNWNLSKAGQKAVAEKAGDYPVRPGSPAPVVDGEERLPALDELDVAFPETWPEYRSDRDAWTSEWLKLFNYSP